MNHGDVETAIPVQGIDSMGSGGGSLPIRHPNQIDPVKIHGHVFQDLNVHGWKFRKYGFETTDIPLVITGHEIDVGFQSAEGAYVLQPEITTIEQISPYQQAVDIHRPEQIADLREVAWWIGSDMHITDEGDID